MGAEVQDVPLSDCQVLKQGLPMYLAFRLRHQDVRPANCWLRPLGQHRPQSRQQTANLVLGSESGTLAALPLS